MNTILFLHGLLLVYSLSAVCSKMAGQQPFLSLEFCVFYGFVLAILFLYAILWQQILKKMRLVTAYANKAVTVVWGLIWGALLFEEAITVWKLLGAVIIMSGIYLVVSADAD